VRFLGLFGLIRSVQRLAGKYVGGVGAVGFQNGSGEYFRHGPGVELQGLAGGGGSGFLLWGEPGVRRVFGVDFFFAWLRCVEFCGDADDTKERGLQWAMASVSAAVSFWAAFSAAVG
jgi:hypothetical protein